jgi:putative membrane protein
MMKHGPIFRFFVSWFVCSLGLWIAARFLNSRIQYNNALSVIVVAGFILAIVNALIRPLVILLSLPAIVFTLGLFVVVINGLMVLLVSVIYPSLQVSGLWPAILAGVVIGLVNYLVSTVLEHQ